MLFVRNNFHVYDENINIEFLFTRIDGWAFFPGETCSGVIVDMYILRQKR